MRNKKWNRLFVSTVLVSTGGKRVPEEEGTPTAATGEVVPVAQDSDLLTAQAEQGVPVPWY